MLATGECWRIAARGQARPGMTRMTLIAQLKMIVMWPQVYEWGVEAMKLASKMKLDGCPTASAAVHLLQQVDAFLGDTDTDTGTPVADAAALQDLNALARKLDNPKLVDQCKVHTRH